MKRVTLKDGYIYKRFLKKELLDPIEIVENRIKTTRQKLSLN